MYSLTAGTTSSPRPHAGEKNVRGGGHDASVQPCAPPAAPEEESLSCTCSTREPGFHFICEMKEKCEI